MSDTTEKPEHREHIIHGTIPPGEWAKFFKQHFVPTPPGEKPPTESRAKINASCEEYGCPHTHPISGGPLTGCNVEIIGGRVVTVYCHYDLKKA